MNLLRILALIAIFLPLQTFAHPVIFRGGTVVMSEIRPRYSMFETSYTFDRSFALAATYSRLDLNRAETPEAHFAGLQLNALVFRINETESQANFYLMGGGGYAHLNQSLSTFSAFAGTQVDFETQSFYTALKFRANWTKEVIPFHIQARVGIAPYKADYSELNTWLVLQVDRAPLVIDQFQISPIMRFFYKSALWEIGASLQGMFFLKTMIHI